MKINEIVGESISLILLLFIGIALTKQGLVTFSTLITVLSLWILVVIFAILDYTKK